MLTLHFICRLYFGGVIAGEYARSFAWTLKGFSVNFLKIAGRLMLPPSDNPLLLTVLFAAIVIGYFSFRMIRKKRIMTGELIILLSLGFSLMIPVVFTLSTRTSEGDRLLYFPSVFFTIYV
ncbi:MAG: hypothetical protein EOO02_09055, partial [Chitinophagaceae bacterium]